MLGFEVYSPCLKLFKTYWTIKKLTFIVTPFGHDSVPTSGSLWRVIKPSVGFDAPLLRA